MNERPGTGPRSLTSGLLLHSLKFGRHGDSPVEGVCESDPRGLEGLDETSLPLCTPAVS